LSKLNAFDLVVTVAFGSTLATAALSRSVAIVEAAAAFILLALLQFVVTSGSTRWKRWRGAVTSSPSLLVREGEILYESLAEERITVDEIAQAVRQQGIGSLAEAGDVVLETDGSLSVIRQPGDRSAYEGLPTCTADSARRG
jgi:uncharacterized membrane protein YcaP (DUF421 family)